MPTPEQEDFLEKIKYILGQIESSRERIEELKCGNLKFSVEQIAKSYSRECILKECLEDYAPSFIDTGHRSGLDICTLQNELSNLKILACSLVNDAVNINLGGAQPLLVMALPAAAPHPAEMLFGQADLMHFPI